MTQKFDYRMTAELIKHRGIGYNQSEIAAKLGVSVGTISYQLKRLRRLAEKEGADSVYSYYTQPLKR